MSAAMLLVLPVVWHFMRDQPRDVGLAPYGGSAAEGVATAARRFARPSMNVEICKAIEAKRLLMFGYGDSVRVVEPHLYGMNTVGNEALSAWLRAGLSRADPEGGWRTYLVPDMYRIQVLDETFRGPRPGYNPSDERMVSVFCGLELNS